MRFVALLLLLAVSGGVRADDLPGKEKVKPVDQTDRNCFFGGTVTAVAKDSISIQGIEPQIHGAVRWDSEGVKVHAFYGNPITFSVSTNTTKRIFKVTKVAGSRDGFTITDADGNVIVLRVKDQPIRTFKFTDDLAAGKVAPGLAAGDSYRPQDVKVGDVVYIRYDRIVGDETCKQIMITERPGGLVPPSPNDRGDVKGIKYHEWRNAQNDFDIRGIPLPDRFLSPAELEERRAKIAPLPHAPIRRIPESQP